MVRAYTRGVTIQAPPSPSRLARWAVAHRGALQNPDELARAAELVRDHSPADALEIGVNVGGTLWLWRRLCSGTVVGLDLGPPGCEPCRRRIAHNSCPRELLARNSSGCHYIESDSRAPSAVRLAAELAPNGYDLLHIDGDHSPDGVRSDFELYSPLVRAGGLVLVHDIAGDHPAWGVVAYWRDVLSKLDGAQAFLTHPTAGGGIGVIPR